MVPLQEKAPFVLEISKKPRYLFTKNFFENISIEPPNFNRNTFCQKLEIEPFLYKRLIRSIWKKSYDLQKNIDSNFQSINHTFKQWHKRPADQNCTKKGHFTLLTEGTNFPSFWRYILLHVWMAYLLASSRNSKVKSVSSPQGTFSSTWISSWMSDKWANLLRPKGKRNQ